MSNGLASKVESTNRLQDKIEQLKPQRNSPVRVSAMTNQTDPFSIASTVKQPLKEKA